MAEIRFDLGQPIKETARKTGVPSFETDNTAGIIEYSVAELDSSIRATFTRPGYEITWGPMFAFIMFADRERTPQDLVEDVQLQLNSRYLKSAAEAHAFIKQTIAQFAKGKWQRFIPDACPRVKGRSSLLDETGAVDPTGGCPIDPGYDIPADEVGALLKQPRYWMWKGGDVIARFQLSTDPMGAQTIYRGELKFELESSYKADQALLVTNSGLSAADRADQDRRNKLAVDQIERDAAKRGEKL